jgi:iron complex outermembrane receptor protein
MRDILIIPVLFILAAYLPPARAGGSMTDTLHIDEVKIVHTLPFQRSPGISSAIDTIPMKLVAGHSLSELLAFQPAIHIKSAGRGALSTASFRGTDASHTKVYWNGIRLNSPMLGQVDFSRIPVWIVDDVSLLYGGSSLEEGSGALGGAVMLGNSADWNGPLSASLNQEIGSFSSLGTYGTLGVGDERVRSDTRIYWNRSENDYPFLNTDVIPMREQRLRQAAYSNAGILQQVYWRPGNIHELAARLWYQEAERDLPPLMSQEGALREERQGDRNLRSSLEWKLYPRSATLLIRSSYAGNRMNYHLYHRDLGYMQFDSRSHENSLYNRIQVDMQAGGRMKFHLRADYNRHDVAILDLVTGQGYKHRRNEGSFLASAYRETGTRWVLYALLREDWTDGSWLPVMPSAGFKFRILDGRSLFLKGNLGRNYNLPSLNDLYWIPGGNPGLRPENSINGDLSIEFSGEDDRLSYRGILNLFGARVEDWILWKPTRFRYWEAENVGLVLSRGFDLQLATRMLIGRWTLSAQASYALTRTTSEGSARSTDASRGKQLIYIPVHASSAYLNFSRKGYFLNWTLSHTGRRYTQPETGEYDFTEVLNPFVLNDVHLGKTWNIRSVGAGLRFTVYNLFNVSYQAVRSRPMPMRNYALTLNMEI